MSELKMTKEEAVALYNANPVESVRFDCYYKYSFTFCGENDVLRLSVSFGGSSDDIYRQKVNTEPLPAPSTYDALLGDYNFAQITRKSDGAEFYEWADKW